MLLALIRIADHYEIDLEQAHVTTRAGELEYLRRHDAAVEAESAASARHDDEEGRCRPGW